MGTAVYVTEVPVQTGFADAVMETLTGSNGLTVIVIVFDVAGFPVAQLRLEVNTQVMRLPLAGIKVYVGLLVPWFTPLTFH